MRAKIFWITLISLVLMTGCAGNRHKKVSKMSKEESEFKFICKYDGVGSLSAYYMLKGFIEKYPEGRFTEEAKSRFARYSDFEVHIEYPMGNTWDDGRQSMRISIALKEKNGIGARIYQQIIERPTDDPKWKWRKIINDDIRIAPNMKTKLGDRSFSKEVGETYIFYGKDDNYHNFTIEVRCGSWSSTVCSVVSNH